MEVCEGHGKLLGSISSLGHDNSTESNDCEPVELEGGTGQSGLQQPASPHLENFDGLVCEMEEKEEEEEAEISPFTSSMSISGIDKATQAALNKVRISHKRHTLLSSSGHERLAPGSQQASIGITNGEATEQTITSAATALEFVLFGCRVVCEPVEISRG